MAAGVLAVGSCGKVESCRTGTLFVTVELGPYASTADRLDVDVTVEAGGDAAASAPKETQLTLTPGARSGGVEVQFPDGYEAGRKVTIALTLFAGGAPLAERDGSQVLPPGCGTLTVDFGAGDAGSPGSGGSAGTNGTGGVGGGASGGAGGGAIGGKGGSGGASGGAGGGAGGGKGGSSGGAAGGRGGSGGAAGGRGGGGGAAGGRGGGAGAATGGAGGAASCKPTGAEDCFDGVDNDCNGKIDCDDPACSVAAQCVTLDPTSAPIGLLSGVGAGACGTAGYDQPTAIFANPNPLSCTTVIAGKGCTCTPGAVSCSTTLAGFKTLAECTGGTSSGESAGPFVTGQDKSCTAAAPPWTPDGTGAIYGIGATMFVATPADCTPSGTANVPTYTFGTKATFCATQQVGGGCAAGQVCVPAATAGTLCQLFNGAKTSCPGGAPAQPFYTGVSGTVTCGACTCGAPAGGSCDSVLLETCSGGIELQSNTRSCVSGGLSMPGVQFSGTPTDGACSPMSAVGGTAAPTGPKTLCCP
jgi:hypothetical protein